jgi:predicted O-linked N-acetylglucosamine transferase (SPINDLY family)
LQKFADCRATALKTVELEPDNYEAWLNLAHCECKSRNRDSALSALEQLDQLQPETVTTWVTKGAVYSAFNWRAAAIEAYDEALAIDAGMIDALINKGHLLRQQRRYAEAFDALNRAYQINPEVDYLAGHVFHLKMLMCDWDGCSRLLERIEQGLSQGRKLIDPFAYQGIARSEQLLHRCTQIYAEDLYPELSAFSPSRPPEPLASREPIRVGYLSGEFRHQATTLLLVEVLEQHQKESFEIYVFDNGFDDDSAVRQRVNKAAHAVVPIADLSDEEAVATIKACRIDILLNLNGYFGKGRQRIFSLRAAPVQVNYLGFPGTLASPYMDYIVADSVVIPPGSDGYYSEKIVRLPNSYQPNDSQKEVPVVLHPRSDFNLPPDAFVFCSFNNSYKITPEMFHTWCQIVQNVADSVLWILVDNSQAEHNLRKAWTAQGLQDQRLIFTKRLPLAEHLARHRLAQLFLDTMPCNAHTTCSDALWAGLPVLTCSGDTFSGRVAASLLKAASLGQLVTHSLADYQAFAIALAHQPERLAAIQHTLAQVRLSPLFNTGLYTEKLELAFRHMVHRARAQLPPEAIQIA